jgi:hypothetical protein
MIRLHLTKRFCIGLDPSSRFRCHARGQLIQSPYNHDSYFNSFHRRTSAYTRLARLPPIPLALPQASITFHRYPVAVRKRINHQLFWLLGPSSTRSHARSCKCSFTRHPSSSSLSDVIGFIWEARPRAQLFDYILGLRLPSSI